MKWIPALFMALLFLPGNIVRAQTVGMNFLDIAPSPLTLSRSDIQSVGEGLPSAMFGNPSLTALEETKSTLEINQTLWLGDSRISFAGWNYKTKKWTIGLAAYSNIVDDIEQRDAPTQNPSLFDARFTAVGFSAARSLGPLNMGITAAYLNEDLLVQNAQGYAINAGISSFLADERVMIGVSVENLGSMENLDINATQLPTNIRVGSKAKLANVSLVALDELSIGLTLMAELVFPFNDRIVSTTQSQTLDPFPITAAEISVDDFLSFNFGYRFDDNLRSFSTGFGFVYQDFKLFYALSPTTQGFEPVHSIGMKYGF